MIDIHLGDPCQRVYVKSLGIELLTTRLEGFLDEYTQACYGSIGFPDETKSAGGSLRNADWIKTGAAIGAVKTGEEDKPLEEVLVNSVTIATYSAEEESRLDSEAASSAQ